MDVALQKYYEERISMMGSQAWKDLIADVETMLEATNTLSGVEDEKTLHYRKGEISIMRWILNLEEISRNSYDQLKEEDAETT
jgi:hypothetical protein